MTVLLLGRHEIEESLLGVFNVSRSDETPCCLREVSRPDQVVSAQVVVALRESPWYGEASDYSAGLGFFLVCSENRIAYPIEVETRLVSLPKVHALRLDVFPAVDKRLLYSIEILQQGIPRLLSRFFRCSSKSKSRNTLAIIRY